MNAAVMQTRATQPMKWLLWREIWEHRALYLVPAITAAVMVGGILLAILFGNADGLPRVHALTDRSGAVVVTSLNIGVAAVFGMIMPLVWIFYCLDALHAERRDRSILFWKSVPVSDAQTVLSKILIVTVVAPLISFVAVVVTELLLLLIVSALLGVHGFPVWKLWAQPAFLSAGALTLYAAAVLSLWSLPVYGWTLLVSAWARRSAFLWAILPLIAIPIFERIVFGTRHFSTMMTTRFVNGILIPFNLENWPLRDNFAISEKTGEIIKDGPEHLASSLFSIADPYALLTSIDLWAGLAVAAVFIAGAIWLRRYREPL